MHDSDRFAGAVDAPANASAPLRGFDGFVPVVTLPEGYGLLPLTLSIAQVSSWTGLGKTLLQDLINRNVLVTSRVGGRTLVLTQSVLALVERNRVERDL